MSELKSAFELASQRIISSKNKKEEKKPEGFDFIEIPEFSNKENKVVEIPGYTDSKEKIGTNETKFIDGTEEMPEEFDTKVEEYSPIHYDKGLMEVCWTGHFMDYGGFARLNRTMVFGLSNRNVKVKIEMEPYLNHVNQSTRKQLEFFTRVELSPSAPKVFGSTMPLNMIHDGKKILYTMIETSEKVHKDYSEKINLMGEVWVATKYGKKIMENSNVKVPIFVMPLGVDTDRYKPDCGIMSFGSKMRRFKFLSVFRWSYRKGFDILLRAYMEEFSRDDDVSLLLVSRAVECPEENGVEKILGDFNGVKAAVKKPEEEMPHIALYTKTIHEKDMPKVYNSCNAFVLISRGEGFCTLPDAKIKTPQGIKEIQDIKVGDHVFSHRGISRKVLQIFKRTYSGKLLKIKCYGRNNQYLYLTPNHSVRGISTNELSNTTSLKLINNCSYVEKDLLCYNHENSEHYKNKYTQYNLEWIESRNLREGDYLFYPQIKYGEIEDLTFVGGNIVLNNIPSFKEKFILKDGKIYKKIVGVFKSKKEICEGLGDKKICTSKLPLFNSQKIEISKDLMKLFGYFVSEGCCDRSSVKFCFHSKETEYHKEVAKLMGKVFGKNNCSIVFPKNKKVAIVIFENIIASRLFEYLFNKGARNKSIPSWFWKVSDELKKSFLHGLFNGDGCYKNITSYSTSSINLANNVFDILRDLNIKSSIKRRTLITNGISREYYAVLISNSKDHNLFMSMIDEDKYKLAGQKRKSHNVFVNQHNCQFVQVRKIEEIDYSGEVYNLGVAIDNSYICENVAVHNCLPYCEAAATGLPIIASNCSGHTDFLNADNSYLVDPEGYEEATLNGKLARMAKLCHFYEGQTFPHFGDEAIQKTREHMRYVYENYGEAKKKADKLKKLVVNNYTWDMAVDKVYDRLKELQ